jgi:hypothetical protein
LRAQITAVLSVGDRPVTMDPAPPEWRTTRDLPTRRATEWLDARAETWQKDDLAKERR